MSQLGLQQHDQTKQTNAIKALTNDNLDPSAIVGRIDDIIDDVNDINIESFELLDHPDTDNINEFIGDALDDFNKVKSSIIAIPDIVSDQYNNTIAGVNLVNARVGDLQRSLNALKLSIERKGATAQFYALLNFTNQSEIDYTFPLEATQADVDITTGSVTLAKLSSESIVDAKFKVLKSNKEGVRDIEQDRPTDFFYEGLYYGYPDEVVAEGDDLHLQVRTSPSRVLSRLATETEKDNIRKRVFDGDFDSSWVCEYVQNNVNVDTGPLDVSILIDLQDTFTISNLTVVPFLVHEGDILDIINIKAGIDASNMTSLNVFTNQIEDSNEREIKPDATSAAENGDFNNRINAMFNPVEARFISLDLRQENAVELIYQLLKVQAIRRDPSNDILIETDYFTLGYLETIGLATQFADDVDPNEFIGALLNINGDWSISSDIATDYVSDRVHQAIGISEIKISNNSYLATSSFVTSKRSFPNIIKNVKLVVDEIIPDSFGTDRWIEYSISFDGNVFHNILPLGSGRSKDELPTIIVPDGQFRDVIVKCVLKRPDGSAQLSPVIKNIRIIAETE